MRFLLYLFATLCLLTKFLLSSSSDSEEIDVSDGDPIQCNPNYVDMDDTDTGEYDYESNASDGDDYDHDEDATDAELVDDVKKEQKPRRSTKTTKSAIKKALSQPSRLGKIIRKQKSKIVVAALVYAFRRELKTIAYRLVTEKVIDKETGQEKRVLNINPVSVIKILFYLRFMMRFIKDDNVDVVDDAAMLPGFGSLSLFKPSTYVPRSEQHWTFERLNERYEKDLMAFQKAMGEIIPIPDAAASLINITDHAEASSAKKKDTKLGLTTLLKELVEKETTKRKYTGTALVMDLTTLTTTVDNMDLIRDQVSLILVQHAANQTLQGTNEAQLEVVVLLESPGGSAGDYGLAAGQLSRLAKEPGIKLTVCVDKVAASGGYMMASTAHQIIAAPFAIVGSIGVYSEMINVHNLLKDMGIEDMVFRAGQNKAPVQLLGEVSKEGIATRQSMLDRVHTAFRQHVATSRPILQDTIQEVANGDIWQGQEALDKKLVDRLLTSDEYLKELMDDGRRLLKICQMRKVLFFGHRRHGPARFNHNIKAKLKEWFVSWILDEKDQVYDKFKERYLSARSATIQTKSTIF
mmetsp:Transcript_28974/g.43772  ORF Transcript_28974/g.43772 Transcript_28974/m.43772 type:complete len:578 (-) Transcript_28974:848-2581(-)